MQDMIQVSNLDSTWGVVSAVVDEVLFPIVVVADSVDTLQPRHEE